jgi:hypothetical protein
MYADVLRIKLAQNLVECQAFVNAMLYYDSSSEVVRWPISSIVNQYLVGWLVLSSMLDDVQGELKRTLHFQSDTENKCGVLRTSHLYQSIEKLSKFCTNLTETRYVLRESYGRCLDNSLARPNLCAVCPS